MTGPSWRTDRRKTAARGYGARWQRERDQYVLMHPLCVMCLAEKPQRITPTQVVDHKVPHRGDPVLFWDRDNWQSLCTTHHSGDKQRLEKTGHVIGGDESGMPADPGHPWRLA